MQPVLASLSAVDMTESRSTMSSQPPEHSDPIAKSFEMSWQFRTVTFRVGTLNLLPKHCFPDLIATASSSASMYVRSMSTSWLESTSIPSLLTARTSSPGAPQLGCWSAWILML